MTRDKTEDPPTPPMSQEPGDEVEIPALYGQFDDEGNPLWMDEAVRRERAKRAQAEARVKELEAINSAKTAALNGALDAHKALRARLETAERLRAYAAPMTAPMSPTDEQLREKVRASVEAFNAMPLVDQAIMRVQQKASFVRGNISADVEWTEAHQQALDNDPAVVLMNAFIASRARLREMEGALKVADGAAYSLATQIVDGLREYTVEHAPDQDAHRRDYAWIERKIIVHNEGLRRALAQPVESGAKEASKSTFSKDCCWPGNCHGGPSCMSEKPTPAAATPPARG